MANWVKTFLDEHPDLAALPVYKRTRRSILFQRGREHVGVFTGAPCHYLDAAAGWLPLDTNLVLDSTRQEYGAPGLATRIKLDGSVRIAGPSNLGVTLYEQLTTRVGILNLSTKKFSIIKNLPAGIVDGENIIRETGIYRHVLRNMETGLREILTLFEVPPFGDVNDWFVLETAVTGASYSDGWLDVEKSTAGHFFPLPSAADAGGNIAPIRRYARSISGVQYLYTGIPLSWLASATYPVMLDPDYVSSTDDAYIAGQNTTYATARSTSNSYNATLTSNNLGQMLSKTTYFIYRAFFVFDTSAIPDTDTVSQVNMTLTSTVDNSATNFDAVIVKSDWSAWLADLTNAANRETAYDNALADTLDDNIWRNTLNMSTNTPYASGNLNTAWVSKIGSTYYALCSSRDRDNTTPTGQEDVAIASQNNATSSYRPFLTVTSDAAATRVPRGPAMYYQDPAVCS